MPKRRFGSPKKWVRLASFRYFFLMILDAMAGKPEEYASEVMMLLPWYRAGLWLEGGKRLGAFAIKRLVAARTCDHRCIFGKAVENGLTLR